MPPGRGARSTRRVTGWCCRVAFAAQRENAAGWHEALAYHRQAIATDPGNALAWAEIARCYTLLARYSDMPVLEDFREARIAAEKALSLDEQLALGHDAPGWVQRTADWNWDGAEKSFRRAHELAPRDAGIMSDLAVLHANRGRSIRRQIKECALFGSIG